MISMRVLVAVLALAGLPLSGHAALDVGEAAPDFTTVAALDGKEFRYRLSESLAKGPVVLYFYPAAFSVGCSIEAHAFAEAIDQFAAEGATVIGVSADDIDVLKKFSVKSCQGKFPVAADPGMDIIKAYDAALNTRPEYANRITYVIAPGGKVVLQYTSLNPEGHIARALAAVRKLRQKPPAG